MDEASALYQTVASLSQREVLRSGVSWSKYILLALPLGCGKVISMICARKTMTV